MMLLERCLNKKSIYVIKSLRRLGKKKKQTNKKTMKKMREEINTVRKN